MTALFPRPEPLDVTMAITDTTTKITAAVPTAAAVVPDNPTASPMKEREYMRLRIDSMIPITLNPPPPETLTTLQVPPRP